MKEAADIFYDVCKEIPCLRCPHKPEGAMSAMVCGNGFKYLNCGCGYVANLYIVVAYRQMWPMSCNCSCHAVVETLKTFVASMAVADHHNLELKSFNIFIMGTGGD